MKVSNKIIILGVCSILTACSSNVMRGSNSGNATEANNSTQPAEQVVGANTKAGVPIGGSVAQSMDSFDRVKLSRALDKSPGTLSSWNNEISGTEYTVTPIKKVSVKGNDFCREYQATAIRGGNKREMTGTACVAADGTWSEV